MSLPGMKACGVASICHSSPICARCQRRTLARWALRLLGRAGKAHAWACAQRRTLERSVLKRTRRSNSLAMQL